MAGQMSSSPGKRREMDLMKLMMSDHEVQTIGDSMSEFNVKFNGPKDTPYDKGVWVVHVELPVNYPYKSPSIGFVNKLYHPNVDEMSGSVCLDVINQSWSPMFDLINVFEVFIPQLLTYPNPADPLNGEAAALMLRDPTKYADTIKEYVEKYATGVSFGDKDEEESEEESEEEEDEEDDMSDEEAAGKMDED
mmetsp:Transcript_5282/g.11715  ORF Transcript_5282/g.11715 Transcript_5282/m.11715 type:complete len:192 (-) Transcript_5282:540-1115(-)